YLPLDPDYPRERLDFILRDGRAQVLISHRRLTDGLFGAEQTRTLYLEEEQETIDRHSAANLELMTGAENLAYVIYTSGSTGEPKGAMNTHRAICNRLFWMQEAYGLDRADRVLQKTPYSFDVSVWEFFWPLMVGAGLVLARPAGHYDARYLVDEIEN